MGHPELPPVTNRALYIYRVFAKWFSFFFFGLISIILLILILPPMRLFLNPRERFRKYEIRAMFCLLGENAEAHPHLVRRIHDEGHYIINHGYFDKWAIRMGEDEFRNNLMLGERAISAALGKELNPKLYRPHGGFYSSGQEKIYRDAGYTMVPSSVRIYDAVITGAKQDKAVAQIIEKVEKMNGGLVLLHDARGSNVRSKRELEKNPQGAYNRSWIPEAVEEIIISLRAKGFIFTEPLI